jgi:hypothetical protein
LPERYRKKDAEVLLSHSKIQPAETKYYHHLWVKTGITNRRSNGEKKEKIMISP